MQHAFGQLDTALLAAGKDLHAVLGPVSQPHTFQSRQSTPSQSPAPQPVQMPLMDQVLQGRELLVKTCRLKNDADPPADCLRLDRDVQTKYFRRARSRNQQRGENPEESGFSAAVGSEKTKDFACRDSKAYPIQSPPFAVKITQALHLDGETDIGRRSHVVYCLSRIIKP